MQTHRLLIALTVGALALAGAQHLAADTTLTELPNMGPYWQPVSPDGTYIYANSFVAGATGDVTAMGTWLNTLNYDANTSLTLEILGQVAGTPQANDILAKSDAITGASGGLALYNPTVASSDVLTAGTEYFFAIDARGGGGNGAYQVGGHSEGSTPGDTGSFWYSNSSNGSHFDGQNRQPEMAFTVTIGSAAAPDTASSLLLLGIGLGALLLSRRQMRRVKA